jgi:hypothetical protein
MMTELRALVACDLARLVRDREVSAREVVQAHLDQIGQVKLAVNAVTAVLEGQALEAVAVAGAALRAAGSGTWWHPAGPWSWPWASLCSRCPVVAGGVNRLTMARSGRLSSHT